MFDAWKQRQRQRLENRPERTVFYNIFATLMLVLAVELLMAVASILAVNVTGQLDENAKDLLTMRVRNRASYMPAERGGSGAAERADHHHHPAAAEKRRYLAGHAG